MKNDYLQNVLEGHATFIRNIETKLLLSKIRKRIEDGKGRKIITSYSSVNLFFKIFLLERYFQEISIKLVDFIFLFHYILKLQKS